MGFILSKFRKKKSTFEVLEALETEITSISKFKANTVVWQKKVVGYLVTYSIVIYLLLALLVYFKLFPAAGSKKDQLLLLLPFLVFPGLIWALRRLLTWWYHRKVRRDDMKLEQLKEKKTKILDEVMEKETYKVAKQILDKFGQNQPSVVRASVPLTGLNRQQHVGGPPAQMDNSQLRRRTNPSLPPTTTSTPSALVTSSASFSTPASRASPVALGPPQGPPATGVPPPLSQSSRPPVIGALSRTAPGPPLPRPVLPRERGYLDKFVEFLVGDGPANRFALICRQCQSHNGMALREEFEYVAYRCCYCYYWNPARKQRPVAPRLPDASTAASASDSSSGSDTSAAPSAQQSRRGSVVEADDAETVAVNTDVNLGTPAPDSLSEVELAQIEKNEASDIEVINKDDLDEVVGLGSEIKGETATETLNNETSTENSSGQNIKNTTESNENMEIDD